MLIVFSLRLDGSCGATGLPRGRDVVSVSRPASIRGCYLRLGAVLLWLLGVGVMCLKLGDGDLKVGNGEQSSYVRFSSKRELVELRDVRNGVQTCSWHRDQFKLPNQYPI